MPKILLVDDDTVTIETFMVAFQRKGFDVRVAFNGDQALDLVTVEPPDAVLLDLRLPGLSANDVCTSLRAFSKTANTPILIVSGATNAEVRAAVPRAAAYVHKPVDLLQLSTLVTKLIEHRCDPVQPIAASSRLQ